MGNFYGNPVEVFAPGACGNVAPIRTIAGSNTTLGLVDRLGVDATGTLYVDNSEAGSIAVSDLVPPATRPRSGPSPDPTPG